MNCGCTEPFTIVEGDTLPILKDTLLVNDVPLDLSASTVEFIATHTLYGAQLTKTATVTNAVAGEVDVAFTASDLQAGTYTYRYRVTTGSAALSLPAVQSSMQVFPRF